MKKVLCLVVMVSICCGVVCSVIAAQSTIDVDTTAFDIEYVQEIFAGAERIDLDPDFVDFYLVYDASNNVMGRIISSEPESQSVVGYAGTVPILIGFDLDNLVAGVTLLENSETPGYLMRLAGREFFENWNGLSMTEAEEKEVDAITGATRTSSAVIQSMQLKLQALSVDK